MMSAEAAHRLDIGYAWAAYSSVPRSTTTATLK